MTARVDLATKVAFLSRPESYPGRPARVETIQTHMSWVFLTERHVYKLKKPVKLEYLDFSTLARRYFNCREELRLNRRLAADVYLAVLPLTQNPAGRLELDGRGRPVEWLVKMKRLPRESMLDEAMASRRVSEAQVRAVARLLVDLYRQAQPEPMTARAYLRRLKRDIASNRKALARRRYGLPEEEVHGVGDALLRFLHEDRDLLAQRAKDHRIVEGHGDLRPEHVCLVDPPVIIDCLEFKRRFRLVDPADELAFLAMECEFADAPEVGTWLFTAYREFSGDEPPPRLVSFYKACRALIRAKLSIWHLDDEDVADTDKWVNRARAYLGLAARHAGRLHG